MKDLRMMEDMMFTFKDLKIKKASSRLMQHQAKQTNVLLRRQQEAL
jgi:hypothetical protein